MILWLGVYAAFSEDKLGSRAPTSGGSHLPIIPAPGHPTSLLSATPVFMCAHPHTDTDTLSKKYTHFKQIICQPHTQEYTYWRSRTECVETKLSHLQSIMFL